MNDSARHNMVLDDHGREVEVDEQAHNELELLNRSMVDKATKIVIKAKPAEPASDLWPQFRQATFDYKRRRSEILKPRHQKPESNSEYSGEDKKFVKQPEHKIVPERHGSLKHTIPEDDIYILWPLSCVLQNVLQIAATGSGAVIQDEHASIQRAVLGDLLIQGELLYQYVVRAVVRILPNIVVKINKSNDKTEVHVLHHIHKHSHQIPAPQPLGMIMIGKWSYTFLSFIQGISLDRIWADLTTDKKCYVREQLNHIFTELRRLPWPSSEGYLGGGMPPMCKGGHRFKKTSSSLIASEAEFNDFLLDDSWLEPARADYIRRSLPIDHQIVMTHGDSCPPNILVESEDILHIAGIVDWETGGAYPEYWEYVNAFKSLFDSQSDWCLYLPEAGIGRFFDEYARHSIIGRYARE